MSNLGKTIDSSLIEQKPPLIIFFKSTFCSKCLETRKVLGTYFDKSLIYEIDISSNEEILNTIKPRIVPTLIVLGKSYTIISQLEGLIAEDKAKKLKSLFDNLNQE